MFIVSLYTYVVCDNVTNIIASCFTICLTFAILYLWQKHEGYPSGSMVDFACDANGSPILAVSSLAVHTKVWFIIINLGTKQSFEEI